jgi:hypothetical protein
MLLATTYGRGSARPVDSYRPPAFGQNQDVRQLLSDWPLTSDGRFGCYLIADSSPYSDLARGVECCVFQRFFGNDPAVMVEEYGDYEAQSSFFFVVDREREQPAGALRVIANSIRGFKTLNDIAREPLSLPLEKVMRDHRIDNLDKCWDVGTLAVLDDYRGKSTGYLVSTILYGLLREEILRIDLEHLIAVLDCHAYRQLVEALGVPFVPISGSEPFPYLGSATSIAAYASVPRILPSMEAHMDRLDSNICQLLGPLIERVAHGVGLPPLVRVT